MDLIVYVRIATDGPVVDVRGQAAQEETVHRWASANGHRIVAVALDEGRSATPGLEERVGLGDALEWLRDGRAAGLVVERLHRLAPDPVLQEQLAAEVERLGGSLFSTRADEMAILAEPDAERAAIRRTIAAVPAFQSALRDLRVRRRVRLSRVPIDAEHAELSRIEALAEHGPMPGEIPRDVGSDGHRLARFLRRLRTRDA